MSASSTSVSFASTTISQPRQPNQYAQPIRSGILMNSQVNETSSSSSSSSAVPQIPDPDYSLSESEGEDESSMILARNTKMNEHISLLPAETSGNSSTRYVS